MKNQDGIAKLQVVQAYHDWQQGQIDRRHFLAACAAAGFSLGGALAGCKPSPATPPSEKAVAESASAASTTTAGSQQRAFLKDVGRAYQGTTLRVISEDTPASKVTRQLIEEEFTALTGIKVEWELTLLERVLVAAASDTASRTSIYDLFYWDQSWLGRFKDDALDPRQLMQKKELAYPDYNFADFLPSLVDNVASHQGQLLGIPFDIPIFIMMYRKDIFEKLNLAVPKTMADYMGAIKTINEAKMPGVYGTTAQWKTGHYSLECNMTAWLWGHGGSVFGANKQPTINDAHGIEAMEYMMEMAKYMPPAAVKWDWNGEAECFLRGQAGIYISWGEFFPPYDDPKVSKIVGLAEAAACPAPINLRSKEQCGFGEVPGVSHQGGSCLALSRYGKHQEAAWIFLQWATSSDVTTRASLLGGGASPIRTSNFDDPRTKEKAKVGVGTTRHFEVTRQAILKDMGTEPHFPAWPELSIDFAVELGKMTTGQQNIKTTANNMAAAAQRRIAS
jgi:multiple sugar transport system substrate-binding protein